VSEVYGLSERTASELRTLLDKSPSTGGGRIDGEANAYITFVRVTSWDDDEQEGECIAVRHITTDNTWQDVSLTCKVRASKDEAKLTTGRRYLAIRFFDTSDKPMFVVLAAGVEDETECVTVVTAHAGGGCQVLEVVTDIACVEGAIQVTKTKLKFFGEVGDDVECDEEDDGSVCIKVLKQEEDENCCEEDEEEPE
jgi:hypothetical protein